MISYLPIKPVQKFVPFLRKELKYIEPNVWVETRQKLKKFQCSEPNYSIVLIARNEERYLFACLASFAEMDIANKKVELLFVNNDSSDRTRFIAEQLGVVIIDEARPGWAEAREAGLERAKGEIILSADGDNIYPSTWFNTYVNILEKRPHVQLACGQYCFYTYDNKYPLSIIMYQWVRFFNSWMRSFKRPHLNAMGGNMVYRRESAIAVGGFKEGIGRGEDGDLALRLSAKGEILWLPQEEAFTHSSLRNVISEGTLVKTLFSKIWLHFKRIPEYLEIS